MVIKSSWGVKAVNVN